MHGEKVTFRSEGKLFHESVPMMLLDSIPFSFELADGLFLLGKMCIIICFQYTLEWRVEPHHIPKVGFRRTGERSDSIHSFIRLRSARCLCPQSHSRPSLRGLRKPRPITREAILRRTRGRISRRPSFVLVVVAESYLSRKK